MVRQLGTALLLATLGHVPLLQGFELVRRLRKILLLGALLTLGNSGGLRTAQAQGQYDFLISVQGGLQHTGYSSNDTYIDKLKTTHGILTTSRVVNPLTVSVELYHLRGSTGVGFGIESHRYTTDYTFTDTSNVSVGTGGLFHNFLFAYQGFFWEPFFGVGTGTYSASVAEQLQPASAGDNSTRADMRISNTQSYQAKLGVRVPLLGGCGVTLSYYFISAPITIPTEGEKLELGGDSTITGLYCKF